MTDDRQDPCIICENIKHPPCPQCESRQLDAAFRELGNNIAHAYKPMLDAMARFITSIKNN